MSRILLTNSGSGFLPRSGSTVSFIDLIPVIRIKTETANPAYPSILIPKNFVRRIDINTTDVATTSLMESSAVAFIDAELIRLPYILLYANI